MKTNIHLLDPLISVMGEDVIVNISFISGEPYVRATYCSKLQRVTLPCGRQATIDSKPVPLIEGNMSSMPMPLAELTEKLIEDAARQIEIYRNA